jgi:hypothetical protein
MHMIGKVRCKLLITKVEKAGGRRTSSGSQAPILQALSEGSTLQHQRLRHCSFVTSPPMCFAMDTQSLAS